MCGKAQRVAHPALQNSGGLLEQSSKFYQRRRVIGGVNERIHYSIRLRNASTQNDSVRNSNITSVITKTKSE